MTLERLSAVIDFELFRLELERAVPRADRSKGSRPPFDHVLMFKVLTLQTLSNLSDERTAAGLAAARAEGRVGGRRPKLTAQQRTDIVENVGSGRRSAAQMARLYKVSQPTV
jgi:DNA invertase Pin-like site-specific DNA recombinase